MNSIINLESSSFVLFIQLKTTPLFAFFNMYKYMAISAYESASRTFKSLYLGTEDVFSGKKVNPMSGVY